MTIVTTIVLATLIPLLARLVRGPTPWDRLLAYNSASNRITVTLAAASVLGRQDALLDVAIIYAALSFLGVVILARFMERGEGFR
jgi:multicomponent Na+:H+ antiporter subunit F